MNRKLFSLEQFSKFVKTRAQITSEYAHALDKLSQKSLSYLYFEESGVCKAWNKLVRMEAEIARVHSSLAEVLQNQVCEQLIHLKDASEKIRKNVCCFFFFTFLLLIENAFISPHFPFRNRLFQMDSHR